MALAKPRLAMYPLIVAASISNSLAPSQLMAPASINSRKGNPKVLSAWFRFSRCSIRVLSAPLMQSAGAGHQLTHPEIKRLGKVVIGLVAGHWFGH
jgi:hypothetical protein